MRTFFIMVLFLLTHSIKITAQQFQVFDSEDKTPLSYVMITSIHSNKYIYTDKEGVFRISQDEYNSTDRLRFQMLGYETLILGVIDMRDSILLSPSTFSIAEVIVHPRKNVILGFAMEKDKKYKNVIFGSPPFEPFRIAVFIANDIKTTGHVSKLLFRYQFTGPDLYIVRPQIYAVSDDGTPGPTLLNKSEVISLSGNGILEILCEQGVIFPENGLFVGFDFIDILDIAGNSINQPSNQECQIPLLFTKTYSNACTFLSWNRTHTWEVISISNSKKQPNAAFGLNLIY